MVKLRSAKNEITPSAGIALTVLCIILGTIFITMPFLNTDIEREDTIPLSGIYESYNGPLYKHNGVTLIFKDIEKQYIDGCCMDYEFEEWLRQLTPGTELEMLIHPKSGDVVELKSDGKTIFDFDYAIRRMVSDGFAFGGFGLCIYGCAVYYGTKTIKTTLKKYKNDKK